MSSRSSCLPPSLHSYYLYTYDKMVAPNVSLRREAEMSPEMLGALLKHHYAHRILSHDEPPMGESAHTQTGVRDLYLRCFNMRW